LDGSIFEHVVTKHLEPLGDSYVYKTYCYITTAVYGNPANPIVCEFRGLRDDILTNFRIGRRFIDWYNRKGPSLAHSVDQHEDLKRASRMILTPVAHFVRCARKFIDKKQNLKSYFYGTRCG
jgi:hypothetical protein